MGSRKSCLLVLAVLSLVLISTAGFAQSSVTGHVAIWGWDASSVNKLLPDFNKVYPKITVEYVPVAYGDLVQKVRTTLASGMDMPDIQWIESGHRGTLLDLDAWDNLEKPPYNFDRKLIFEYLYPLLTNPRGELVALDWGGCMAGLAYRRDIAKAYLGTDSPEDIQKIFSSWDAFLTKGKEIRQKSGGKVFMFACDTDVRFIMMNANPLPYVVGNKLNFDPTIGKTLHFVVDLAKADLLDTADVWSPAYMASFKTGNYMFYPCPPWMLAQIDSQDPDGTGKWGLMIPPGGGFNYGGTAWAISKASKNKTAAWEFMKWFLLSEQGSKLNKDINKQWGALKSLYKSPEFASIKDVRFGNQDLGDVWFNRIAPKMKLKAFTKWDAPINDAIDLVDQQIKLNKIDYDAAVKAFKDELNRKAPELQF